MAQTPKSSSRKPRTSKPKVSSANKKNINTSESNSESVLLSTSEPKTTLQLTSSNLATHPLDQNNHAVTSSNEDDANKLELIDLNSPVDGALPDKLHYANQSQTTPEFAGFIVPSGCGNVLKAEREAQGLSLSEVCKSLRLSINQIQAIEKDDFSNLPKQSIVRGFIRNYARLLKIDAEPILRAFQNIVPNEAPLSLSVKATADESVIGAKEIKFTPKIIFNILLTMAVFVALSYLYTHYIKPKSLAESGLNLSADEIQKSNPNMMALPLPAISTTTSDQTSNLVTNQASNPALSSVGETRSSNSANSPSLPSATSRPTTQTSLTTDTSDATKLENSSETVIKQALVSDSATSSLTATTNATVTKQTANTTTPLATNASRNPTRKESDSLLDFKLSAESWIRVESADGKTIFSELLPAGTQQTINAKPPFNIIIGNAGATKVSIDNQEYDLAPITRANVARVQIK